MTNLEQQDIEAFKSWANGTNPAVNPSYYQAWQAALAYERGKSDDDDQMTDGWLRSVGGVEPDYTEDFTETTFCFDLDNDHCLNVEVDTQRVYIYDAKQEHVAIELPHIKTKWQFMKLLSSLSVLDDAKIRFWSCRKCLDSGKRPYVDWINDTAICQICGNSNKLERAESALALLNQEERKP